MKTAGNLVVLGSINADHILNLESFPTPGETVTGNQYQVAFGGKGANQAVAAGRSGAHIAFIACTGDDDTGERVRKQLASDNIDIAPVSVVAGESTGVALIFVNAEGENVIGIHAGANAALTTERVEAQREIIASAEALLMQLESQWRAYWLRPRLRMKIIPLSYLIRRLPVYYQMSSWRWWISLPLTKPKPKS